MALARYGVAVVVMAGAVMASSLAGGAFTATSSAAPAAATLGVTAGLPGEFRFRLSKAAVPHGKVTIIVTNRGNLPHDFKIAGKKTPLLQSGKSARLVVTFKKAGRYPYQCTVTGHAAAGMKGTLRVK